ncbi:MAG: hypothetical protein RR086_02255 [Clostridia bacterium]
MKQLVCDAEKLKLLITTRGLSVVTLASSAGISEERLNNLLMRKTIEISILDLSKIALALRTEVANLVL